MVNDDEIYTTNVDQEAEDRIEAANEVAPQVDEPEAVEYTTERGRGRPNPNTIPDFEED